MSKVAELFSSAIRCVLVRVITLPKNISGSSLSSSGLRGLGYLKVSGSNVTSCWKDVTTSGSESIFIKSSPVSDDSWAVISRRSVGASSKVLTEGFGREDGDELVGCESCGSWGVLIGVKPCGGSGVSAGGEPYGSLEDDALTDIAWLALRLAGVWLYSSYLIRSYIWSKIWESLRAFPKNRPLTFLRLVCLTW